MSTASRNSGGVALGAPAMSVSERMRAVALAGARMVSAGSADVLVAVLKEATSEIMAIGDLGIGLYDPVSQMMHFTGGFDSGVFVPPISVSVVGTPSEGVIRDRKTLVTLESGEPASHGAMLVGTGIRSESTIRTPILADERVLGVVVAQSYVPRAYSDEDVQLLETLASLCASALLNIEALEALARSERMLQEAQEIAQLVRWEWEIDSGRLTFSCRFAEVFSLSLDRAPTNFQEYLALVHPADRPQVQAVLDGGLASGEQMSSDHRGVRPDGTLRYLHCRGIVEHGATGRPVRVVGTMQDITERRELEELLRQAQKMEAVGQLAGGVAHDFNNLLTAIFVSLEFIREDLPADSVVRPDVEEIGRAADRARSLVRQLLTFSRKQPIQNQRVRLGDVVARSQELLRRVIGEEILLEVHVSPDEWEIEADPAQLEQVLLNLAVNARDAMLTPQHGHAGRGGALIIEVGETTLSAADSQAWDGALPGRYMRLSVRDNGHGMDAATRAHVFEPFFTTKDVGAGAGLGLATVFGIIRQLGGAAHVASTVGSGATFSFIIPIASSAPIAEVPFSPARVASSAPVSGTILVVEDETPVREMVRRILERRGYTVLEARHGEDAMLLWRAQGAHIDALVTDLRMPVMGGRELADAVLRDAPDLPVVFMSGYSSDGMTAANGRRHAFVAKPFTSEALTDALAQVIATPA